MIERYSRPEMREIWSDEGRYRRWLEVELAATDELAERGVVPHDAAAEVVAIREILNPIAVQKTIRHEALEISQHILAIQRMGSI